MSGRLDWERAQRDNARQRRYAQRHGDKPLAVDHGKPASDKQLGYIHDLAVRLGSRPASVQTAYQARLEIELLKQRIAVKERMAAQQ